MQVAPPSEGRFGSSIASTIHPRQADYRALDAATSPPVMPTNPDGPLTARRPCLRLAPDRWRGRHSMRRRNAHLLFGLCLVFSAVACVPPPPTAEARPQIAVTAVVQWVPGAYSLHGTVKNVGSAPGDFQFTLRYKASLAETDWANVIKVLPGQTAIWSTGILGMPSTVTASDFEVAETRVQPRPEVVAAPISAVIDSVGPPCTPPPSGPCGLAVSGTLSNIGPDTYKSVSIEMIGTNGYTGSGQASQVGPGQAAWSGSLGSDGVSTVQTIVRVVPCFVLILGTVTCGGP